MSYDTDSISAGDKTIRTQMVEEQMKRVQQRVDNLKLETPPDEQDVKNTKAALNRVQSIASIIV